MPNYYDSTKKKPGKAKLKYAKGGNVKKMSNGGRTVTKKDRLRDAKIKKEHQESYTTVNGILMYKGKPVKRMSAADRAAREKKEQAAWDAKYDLDKFNQEIEEKKQQFFEKRPLGKVKNMKGGGTVARGSGAARPQAFRKNG